jgi:serine/threonine protein kinase
MSDYRTQLITKEPLQTIGRYRLLRRVGCGGMGEVWVGEDPHLRRQVAIKTLPLFDAQDQEVVQRFEREARVVAALTHPHILSIHDHGKQRLANGSLLAYLVMPYIEGGSVATRLPLVDQQPSSQEEPLGQQMPTAEAFALLKQAAEAIDFAHQKKVIHRDIKPSNLLLRDDGWLLLADFGIACHVSGSKHLTRTGQGVGSPEYMAPEQIQGKATIVSDIYGLAIIIYQVFTGRVPFRQETAIATIIQQLNEAPPDPRQFNPALPSSFVELLLCGLHKDPEQRPALASEFVAQLERAFADPTYQPTSLRTIRDLPELVAIEDISMQIAKDAISPSRTISRRQILFGAGVASSLLVGGGLGVWGIENLLEAPLPNLAPQPTISARPRRAGADLPALVLTGHTNSASYLTWTSDGQTLISTGRDGQVLRWDLPQLLQQPNSAYGTPLYKNAPLQFLNDAVPVAWSFDNTMLAVANTQNEVDQITIYTSELRVKTRISVEKDPALSSYIIALSWLSESKLLFVRWKMDEKARSTWQTVSAVDCNQPDQRWTLLEKQQQDYRDEELTGVLAPSSAKSLVRGFLLTKSILLGEVTLTDQATWQPKAVLSRSPDGETGPVFVPANWNFANNVLVGVLAKSDGMLPATPAYLKDWRDPASPYIRMKQLESKSVYFMIEANPGSETPGLALATESGEVFLWDLKENTAPVRRLDSGGVWGFVRSISWSPDGRWLAVGYEDQHFSIIVWHV